MLFLEHFSRASKWTGYSRTGRLFFICNTNNQAKMSNQVPWQFFHFINLVVTLNCFKTNGASDFSCPGTQHLNSLQSCSPKLKMTRRTCWMLQLWLWHWVHRNGGRVKVTTFPLNLKGTHTAVVWKHTCTHEQITTPTYTQLRVIWHRGQGQGAHGASHCDLSLDNRGSISPLLAPPHLTLTSYKSVCLTGRVRAYYSWP